MVSPARLESTSARMSRTNPWVQLCPSLHRSAASGVALFRSAYDNAPISKAMQSFDAKIQQRHVERTEISLIWRGGGLRWSRYAGAMDVMLSGGSRKTPGE